MVDILKLDFSSDIFTCKEAHLKKYFKDSLKLEQGIQKKGQKVRNGLRVNMAIRLASVTNALCYTN